MLLFKYFWNTLHLFQGRFGFERISGFNIIFQRVRGFAVIELYGKATKEIGKLLFN